MIYTEFLRVLKNLGITPFPPIYPKITKLLLNAIVRGHNGMLLWLSKAHAYFIANKICA